MKLNNRAVYLIALLLLAARVLIAWQLPLLGDEAFYWQESQHLALSYSDLPPLTAWLIAMGTGVAGHTPLGVRWPFLILGTLPFLQLWQWALRRGMQPAQARQVACFALFLPLLAVNGVLALPDVPLTVLMLQAFITLDRAADSGRWRDWWVFGLVLGLALLAHWRAAVLFVAGLVWMMGSVRGRQRRSSPKLWSALALAALLFVPVLMFNANHDWTALRFQLLERNPWRFQLSGFWIVPEQILMLTPALAAVLLAAFVMSWQRRNQAAWDLLFPASSILLLYVFLGLFADNQRTRIHWPLPAYLPCLLLVPAVLQRWAQGLMLRRVCARWALSLSVLGALCALSLLGAAASSNTTTQSLVGQVIGDSFRGWNKLTKVLATQRRLHDLPDRIIADNFLLGSQLDFALQGQIGVHVLDHPRNRKHGRQTQLSIWSRDEKSLLQGEWTTAWLFVELPSRAIAEQMAAMRALCAKFGSVRWTDEVIEPDSNLRFLLAQVHSLSASDRGECQIPVLGRMDYPGPEQAVAKNSPMEISGWALANRVGVDRVSVWFDGRQLGVAALGDPAQHAQRAWPDSRDPDQPLNGFRFTIPASLMTPGPHHLHVEVHSRDPQALSRSFSHLRVWAR